VCCAWESSPCSAASGEQNTWPGGASWLPHSRPSPSIYLGSFEREGPLDGRRQRNFEHHLDGESRAVYNWQGGPSDNGAPIHATRQISSNPAIFEFATPIGGTYPPWYDPIYWSQGAKIAFRPGDFARALLRQIQLYGYLVTTASFRSCLRSPRFFLVRGQRPHPGRYS